MLSCSVDSKCRFKACRPDVMAVGQRGGKGDVDFKGKESVKYECTAMVDGWIDSKAIRRFYAGIKLTQK